MELTLKNELPRITYNATVNDVRNWIIKSENTNDIKILRDYLKNESKIYNNFFSAVFCFFTGGTNKIKVREDGLEIPVRTEVQEELQRIFMQQCWKSAYRTAWNSMVGQLTTTDRNTGVLTKYIRENIKDDDNLTISEVAEIAGSFPEWLSEKTRNKVLQAFDVIFGTGITADIYQAEVKQRINCKAITDICLRAHNIILYGPPGTGKTHLATKAAKEIIGESGNKDNQIKTVQFHPSYSYFDFVEGIEAGSDGFKPKSKLFRSICETAERDSGKPYVLIIDEVNRTDTASVLGELLYALEYRGRAVETTVLTKPLTVPDNLYIIGTMNTADRSIGSMDYAVRRRFTFVNIPSVPPEEEEIENGLKFFKNAYDIVRTDIEKFVARGTAAEDIMPGTSYYLARDEKHFNYKLTYELLPLLQEYAKDGLFSARQKTDGKTFKERLLYDGKAYISRLMTGGDNNA